MKNQTKLFKVYRSQVTDAVGRDHTFYFRYYQGRDCVVPTEYRGIQRAIQIKAFSLVIEEVVTYGSESEVIDSKEHDFGYLCARSGELVYSYGQMKRYGESMEDMIRIIDSLRMDFTTCMEKDAYRELKRQLGARPDVPTPNRMRRSKPSEPLDKIHLPWMKKD